MMTMLRLLRRAQIFYDLGANYKFEFALQKTSNQVLYE